MKAAEFLSKKVELQKQLDELSDQLADIRNAVVLEIGAYIPQFNITLDELKKFYAPVQVTVASAKKGRKPGATNKPAGEVNRKNYAYFDKENNRWFNGHTTIPKWFDLTKADSYLVPGKKHTNKVLKAIDDLANPKTIKIVNTKAKAK
jgi:hypothetical protein